jgi:hypothetical protein
MSLPFAVKVGSSSPKRGSVLVQRSISLRYP